MLVLLESTRAQRQALASIGGPGSAWASLSTLLKCDFGEGNVRQFTRAKDIATVVKMATSNGSTLSQAGKAVMRSHLITSAIIKSEGSPLIPVSLNLHVTLMRDKSLTAQRAFPATLHALKDAKALYLAIACLKHVLKCKLSTRIWPLFPPLPLYTIMEKLNPPTVILEDGSP